jgi:REP element-mobilizing transposase RayT
VAYDPHRHNRRSTRLPGRDYARSGAYFVTICTQDRDYLFGEVTSSRVTLNAFGEIADECWADLPRHYGHVMNDAFVVMPNHVHGIIVLGKTGVGAGLKPAPTRRHTLSEVVRAFKTFSARRINDLRGTPGQRVWQRNYHERVVRDRDQLRRVRGYIARNPAAWDSDEENPAVIEAASVGAAREPALGIRR